MLVATQEDLLSLSSSFSKMLKKGYGKGPETCNTVLKGNKLYVYLGSFMTPSEEILVESQEINLVTRFRSAVMTSLSQNFIEEASSKLNINFDSLFHDWNFESNSGILLMENNDSPVYEANAGQSLMINLYELFQVVGSKMHKVPDSFKLLKYTINICVVELTGVLFPLAYQLCEQGNVDLLLTYTQDIKNEYIEQKYLFEHVFTRKIEDIFILWDFQKNKNYFVFSFTKQIR